MVVYQAWHNDNELILALSHPNSDSKSRGFPGGSDSKESADNAGDLGLIPGSGRPPGDGNSYQLQYFSPVFLPGEFHGQRSLVGHSPLQGLQRVRHY